MRVVALATNYAGVFHTRRLERSHSDRLRHFMPSSAVLEVAPQADGGLTCCAAANSSRRRKRLPVSRRNITTTTITTGSPMAASASSGYFAATNRSTFEAFKMTR
jgi:hypothetical protein